jgi:hypothetical protein
MITLIIKSNPNSADFIPIPDMGILVPPSGGDTTLTDIASLIQAAKSKDLRELSQDDFYNPAGSSLILNDGTIDIDPTQVDVFLNTVFLQSSGAFSVVLRDQNEDPGLGAFEIDYDDTLTGLGVDNVQDAIDSFYAQTLLTNDHESLDTLTHELVETHYEEVTYDVYDRITSVIAYVDNTKSVKVREITSTYVGLSRRIDVLTEIQYDAVGSELYRLTTTYAYNGLMLLSSETVRTSP